MTYEEFKKLFYSEEFVEYDEDYRNFVLNMLKENINTDNPHVLKYKKSEIN